MSKYCSNLFVLVKRNRREKNKRKKFRTTYLMCFHPNNCSLRLMFGLTEKFSEYLLLLFGHACNWPALGHFCFLSVFQSIWPISQAIKSNSTNKFKKLLKEFQLHRKFAQKFQLHSHSINIIVKKMSKYCSNLFVLVKRNRREKKQKKKIHYNIFDVLPPK